MNVSSDKMNIPKDIKSLKSKCFISTPHSMYNKMKVKPPCNTIVLLNRFYHVLYSTTIHNIPKVFPGFFPFSKYFFTKEFTKSSYETEIYEQPKRTWQQQKFLYEMPVSQKIGPISYQVFLLQMQLQALSSNTRLFCSSFCHKPTHEVC